MSGNYYSQSILLTVFSLQLLPVAFTQDICPGEAAAMALCGLSNSMQFQECGNCLDMAEVPYTCQGAMTTVESCNCNQCEDVIKTFYVCQMKCDEGGPVSSEIDDVCGDEIADFMNCVITNLSESDFVKCAPDDFLSVDITGSMAPTTMEPTTEITTCADAEIFLNDHDCGICNSLHRQAWQCSLKEEDGLDCNLSAGSNNDASESENAASESNNNATESNKNSSESKNTSGSNNRSGSGFVRIPVIMMSIVLAFCML